MREEQLKERLGERFRELDIPLLVEWPDGRRGALVFVIEEESDPRRFSVSRLAHYCLDIAELLDTRRVVPVVVFLRGGPAERGLILGGDDDTYLDFRFLAVELATLPYETYRDSPNIVVRLNLPNMAYPPQERVAVYAAAVRGLLSLEPDPERQRKYLDFVDIYAALTEDEQACYEREYREATHRVGRLRDAIGMAGPDRYGRQYRCRIRVPLADLPWPRRSLACFLLRNKGFSEKHGHQASRGDQVL